MADNFLEKRMEDHRRGLDHGRLSPSPVSKKRRLTVDIDRLRIVMAGELNGIAETVITVAAAGGARMAFTGIDANHGRLTAQKTGALFVPSAAVDSHDRDNICIATAAGRWDEIDTIVVTGGNPEYAEALSEHFPDVRLLFITEECDNDRLGACVKAGITVINISDSVIGDFDKARLIVHIASLSLPAQLIKL